MNTTNFTDSDDSDFDLDIRLIEGGDNVAELLNTTGDNCGQTPQSAGVTCYDS